MNATRYIAAGVIALFALSLACSAYPAENRHDRGSVVIKTDKGRIVIASRELRDLRKLRDLRGLSVRIRGDRGRLSIDLKGVEVSARKIERAARRLERKIERKLERLDSRERRRVVRILEDFDLDLDLDFDFDFDWNLN